MLGGVWWRVRRSCDEVYLVYRVCNKDIEKFIIGTYKHLAFGVSILIPKRTCSFSWARTFSPRSFIRITLRYRNRMNERVCHL